MSEDLLVCKIVWKTKSFPKVFSKTESKIVPGMPGHLHFGIRRGEVMQLLEASVSTQKGLVFISCNSINQSSKVLSWCTQLSTRTCLN